MVRHAKLKGIRRGYITLPYSLLDLRIILLPVRQQLFERYPQRDQNAFLLIANDSRIIQNIGDTALAVFFNNVVPDGLTNQLGVLTGLLQRLIDLFAADQL